MLSIVTTARARVPLVPRSDLFLPSRSLCSIGRCRNAPTFVKGSLASLSRGGRRDRRWLSSRPCLNVPSTNTTTTSTTPTVTSTTTTTRTRATATALTSTSASPTLSLPSARGSPLSHLPHPHPLRMRYRACQTCRCSSSSSTSTSTSSSSSTTPSFSRLNNGGINRNNTSIARHTRRSDFPGVGGAGESNLSGLANFFRSKMQKSGSTDNAPAPEYCSSEDKYARTYHGIRVPDPYLSLMNPTDQVLKHLEMENRFTELQMEETKKLQETIFAEMQSRIHPNERSVPEYVDGFWYYSRIPAGENFQVFCRKQGTMDAKEQVMVDTNAEGEGEDFIGISMLKVSKNQRNLAYVKDTKGDESFKAVLLDLGPSAPKHAVEESSTAPSTATTSPSSSSSSSPSSATTTSSPSSPESSPSTTSRIRRTEVIERVYSVEWAADSQTLLYTVPDELHRPYKAMRHTFGTSIERDVCLYEETDPAFYLDVGRTKDHKFLVISSNSKTTSEVRVLDSRKPLSSTPRLIAERREGVQYFLDHCDSRFYMVNNADGAANYQVSVVNDMDPAPENWQVLVPAQDNARIEDMDVFEKHVVTYETREGLPGIRVLDLNDGASTSPPRADGEGDDDDNDDSVHYVTLPYSICTLETGANTDFTGNRLRFQLSSPLLEEAVYDYDLANRKLECMRETPIQSDPPFDSADYTLTRLHAPSPTVDGEDVQVPITVYHKKDLPLDGSNPLLMHVYGAYGHKTEAEYRHFQLSLLQRGWVLALAHVRGGGELGHQWYEGARGAKKRVNSFNDFIHCTEHMIEQGYSSKGRIGAVGVSAGGLTLAAVANMKPGLFRAMLAKVPFVDAISAMSDKHLPLTIAEYPEWGNPDDEEDFKQMISWDPYQNIKEQEYPAILATASLMDIRVPYWMPAKWVQRIRANKTDSHRILFKVDQEMGHFGEGGRYSELHDRAFEYAFLIRELTEKKEEEADK
eukprot:TRINITY_DN958_c0_g2_i1.p1 TRINITY_DN958_c0_g2~~TRINITY_DN958_c0_g2_i1.p1  ORF type:complete len:973 (-),score=211.69 TRINITY_DN958_c0_g2_i1:620-3538(-)